MCNTLPTLIILQVKLVHYFIYTTRITTNKLVTGNWLLLQTSQSHIMTDNQSASQSWCQAPIWDPRPIFLFSP
jgi:hypothetical protein